MAGSVKMLGTSRTEQVLLPQRWSTVAARALGLGPETEGPNLRPVTHRLYIFRQAFQVSTSVKWEL